MINMMAVVESPGKVTLREEEVSKPGPGQVLIRVKASSICGSDLHIFKGKHPSAPLPVTVGHELAGDVVETGQGVTRFKSGDRVVVEPVLVCGTCSPCREGTYGYCDNLSFHYRRGQGALTRYFLAPEEFTYPLPAHLSYEAGALIEPLAVAVHAVKRANVQMGEKVLVLGAGAIGILVAALCRLVGAEEVITADLADFRLEKAKQMGATRTINTQRDALDELIRKLIGGRGVDKSFECVGIEKTLLQAMESLRKGGVATVLGIFEEPRVTLPSTLFVAKEITVQGAQGYCWDFRTALGLTQRIDLTQLVTHIFPLEQVSEAFAAALRPEDQPLKVLIRP